MALTAEINGKIVTIDDCERTPCEIFSRVMGYYRPVTTDGFKTTEWNPGKVQEHKDRKWYRLNQNNLDTLDKHIKEIETLEKINKVV